MQASDAPLLWLGKPWQTMGSPSPHGAHVILEFDDGLTSVRVLAHGAELASVMGKDRDAAGARVYSWPDDVTQHVATLQDPVLVTDHHKISGLPPVVRDSIFKLYESPVRVTRYGGTSLRFEQRAWPGVWGPNIDTLLFCQALTPARLAGVKSVLEIGCGSGFISQYILEHAPQVEQLTMVDINPAAVACATQNVLDPRASADVQDGMAALRAHPVDLVVCNPPYIPRPGAVADNAYEGIDLLAFFFTQAPALLAPGGQLITVVSSVADGVVRPLRDASGVSVEELSCRKVPLKVLNVLNNPEWMAYLHQKAGVTSGLHQGYEHWHTVRICCVRPAPG